MPIYQTVHTCICFAAKLNIRSADRGNEPGGNQEYASITADLAFDNRALPRDELPSSSNLPPTETRGKIFSNIEVIRLSASGTERRRVGQNFKNETTDDRIHSTQSKSWDEDCVEMPGRTFIELLCQRLKMEVT
jgi:hypothetical protein